MFMIDLGVESHYSLLGVDPEASPKDIREAKTRIAGDLERQRQRARTPDERRSLEERMVRINAAGDTLAHPQKRGTYDGENTHLTFFVVRKAAAPALEEREVMLRWVHQAIRDFLSSNGEEVDPLSDLERWDFRADFTPNELLERLESRGRQS